MLILNRKLSAALAAALLAVGAAGCGGEAEQEAEEAGNAVEQEAEEAGNAAEDAGNAVEQEVEEEE